MKILSTLTQFSIVKVFMKYKYIMTGDVDKMNMKKVVALTLAVGAFLMTTACAKPAPSVEHTRYTANGRYYTDGTVITNDGNIWGYSTDIISDQTPTDDMPVWVGFDDNGTPDIIEDDIILGLVYDRETAIYDELEKALGEKFTITREGNNIKIGE